MRQLDEFRRLARELSEQSFDTMPESIAREVLAFGDTESDDVFIKREKFLEDLKDIDILLERVQDIVRGDEELFKAADFYMFVQMEAGYLKDEPISLLHIGQSAMIKHFVDVDKALEVCSEPTV